MGHAVVGLGPLVQRVAVANAASAGEAAVDGTNLVTSMPLGIATSLSVVAPEIPQEVGDLAILLESGYSKKRACFTWVAEHGPPLSKAGVGKKCRVRTSLPSPG